MKCKKCGIFVSRNNVTGLCRNCRQNFKSKKQREKKKNEKRCIDCGKFVNPVIIYPDGLAGIKVVKNFFRCYKCRIKRKEYMKKWNKNA